MKRIFKSYFLLIAAGALIITLDQVTKFLVRTNLGLGEVWSPWIWLVPYARIVHWSNTGVAFGMFQGAGEIFKYLAIIIAIAILYYFPRIPTSDWIIRIALIMQFGGAVGNLIDRIQFGAVIDYISIGSFPVFNVADSSISVGVVILLIGIWLQEHREKKAARKTVESLPDEPVGNKETLP